MKKTTKKGFTLVELVIVIAIIAILAAVLIPTFSGVVKKANESAALQAARNAYTAIMAETNATFADVKAVDGTEHTVLDASPTGNAIIDLDDYFGNGNIKAVSFDTSTTTITVEVQNGAKVTINANGAAIFNN